MNKLNDTFFKNAHPKAKKAISTEYIGSIPGAIQLGSADIGKAELEDGTIVYTTWGRNLDRKAQNLSADRGMPMIWMGADDGSCEYILRADFFEFYKNDLIKA